MENCFIWFGIDVIIIAVKPKWWVYYSKFFYYWIVLSVFFIIIVFKQLFIHIKIQQNYFVCFYFLFEKFLSYFIFGHGRNTQTSYPSSSSSFSILNRNKSNEINSVYRAINLDRGSRKMISNFGMVFYLFHFYSCSFLYNKNN